MKKNVKKTLNSYLYILIFSGGLLSQCFAQNNFVAKDLSESPILKAIYPTSIGFEFALSNPSPSIKLVNQKIQIECLTGQTAKIIATDATNFQFKPLGDYTIEFRVAVPLNNGRGLDVSIRDGRFSYPLINVSHEKLFGFTLGRDWFSLDAKRYHTYRLGVIRSIGEVHIWIDGVYKGILFKTPDSTSANLFEFGKGSVSPSTHIYLEYLTFDFTGVYKPLNRVLEMPNLEEKNMSLFPDLDGSINPAKVGWSIFNYSDYRFENNYYSSTIKELRSEVSTVYVPQKTNDWQYAHHPSIAYFKNKFVAIFSNGRYGEDEPGQRVLVSTSTDAKIWSNCNILVETDQNHILTPGGLYVANDNLLIAYYTTNDYDIRQQYLNPHLFALTSADGINWSTPIDLEIPLFACHSPIKTNDGKLLITGGKSIYYTTDLDGLSGWKLSENRYISSINAAKVGLTEGLFLQLPDSVYILYRDVIGKTLLWQQSSHNGENWGELIKTKFTNCNTKSHFGKLSNNNYYYVGTPDTLNLSERRPLVLSLSENGFSFSKNYIISDNYYPIKYDQGRWKGGQYGYPYSIVHNGCLYVIVSRRKEKMEVYKIDLSQIDN